MPAQVADAVAVGVRERARVDLVDDRGLPPRLGRCGALAPRPAAGAGARGSRRARARSWRAAAARDDDAGGGHAGDPRDAQQLPVVRSHGSRRLGSVSGLAFEDAIATSATGDLWLFRGRSLADRAIQTVTNAPVNHVGMVVALDDLPPLLWHAELGRSLPDVWTGERQRGVQLHVLPTRSDVGQRYGQRAWLRQLEGELQREHEDRLMQVIERFDGRSFPTTAGLARQWLTGRYRRRESSLETSTARSSSRRPTSTWACCRSAAGELVRPGPLLERRPHRARAAVRARRRDRRRLTGAPLRSSSSRTSGGWAPDTATRRSMTKIGTALMPKPRAVASSSRTSAAKRSLASISRTSPSAGRPRARAARASRGRRSARPRCGRRAGGAPSSRVCRPRSAARCSRRWRVERVAGAGEVEAQVEPVDGRHRRVMLLMAWRAPASTLIPYFSARCSAPRRSRAGGAVGVELEGAPGHTSTSSRCSNARARPRSGACRRSTRGTRCRTRSRRPCL